MFVLVDEWLQIWAVSQHSLNTLIQSGFSRNSMNLCVFHKHTYQYLEVIDMVGSSTHSLPHIYARTHTNLFSLCLFLDSLLLAELVVLCPLPCTSMHRIRSAVVLSLCSVNCTHYMTPWLVSQYYGTHLYTKAVQHLLETGDVSDTGIYVGVECRVGDGCTEWAHGCVQQP